MTRSRDSHVAPVTALAAIIAILLVIGFLVIRPPVGEPRASESDQESDPTATAALNVRVIDGDGQFAAVDGEVIAQEIAGGAHRKLLIGGYSNVAQVSDGRAQIAVPPGLHWRVAFRDAEGAPQRGWGHVIGPADHGGSLGLDVVLGNPGPIIEATILGPDGEPCRDRSVWVALYYDRVSAHPKAATADWVETDTNGKIRWALDDGLYRGDAPVLVVEIEEHEDEEPWNRPTGTARLQGTPVTIQCGVPPILGAGRVLDARGRLVDRAHVVAEVCRGEPPAWLPVASAITDENGEFELLAHPRVGDVRLQVVTPAGYLDRPVSFQVGEKVDLHLKDAGAIAAPPRHVDDSTETWRCVPAVMGDVVAYSFDRYYMSDAVTMLTEEEPGALRANGLRPGRGRVVLLSGEEQRIVRTLSVNVRAGETTVLHELGGWTPTSVPSLRPTRVHLRDLAGRPAPVRRIWLRPTGQKKCDWTPKLSRVPGRFTCRAAGPFDVAVRNPHYRATIVNGVAAETTITLQPGIPVSVRLAPDSVVPKHHRIIAWLREEMTERPSISPLMLEHWFTQVGGLFGSDGRIVLRVPEPGSYTHGLLLVGPSARVAALVPERIVKVDPEGLSVALPIRAEAIREGLRNLGQR